MRSLAVIAVALVALLAGAAGAGGGTTAAAPQHSIVVTGNGAVTTVPDRAQLSFGVVSDGKTASAALRANAAEATKVIAAIKAQGIAAPDIRTEQVSLSPRYTQNGDGIVGYTATNSVGVTLRNLDKTGGVIDAAVDAGANQVSGPNLVRSDQSALYRTTLRAAIADAKAKDRTIAGPSWIHRPQVTHVRTDGS